MDLIESWIVPNWPAPANVRAFSTTRHGGVSREPFDSMNPAGHTGDDPDHVVENRRLLKRHAGLEKEPLWLSQVHGDKVVDATRAAQGVQADGSVSSAVGVACAVLTADCLPVLLCDTAGTQVAALHAGWRGLAGGILEAGVRSMQVPPQNILAWLGPCIGPRAFEVGEEVRQAFVSEMSEAAAAFTPSRPEHWLADLQNLAELRLNQSGVNNVYKEMRCTSSQPADFFSYRRDGVCGRMASVIWIQE